MAKIEYDFDTITIIDPDTFEKELREALDLKWVDKLVLSALVPSTPGGTYVIICHRIVS